MRRLNVWLALAVAVCAVSFWFGRGAFNSGSRPDRVGQLPGTWDAQGQQAVQLVVLNGTHQTGLARQFGLLLGQRGLAPTGYGNAPPQDHERSFLVNRKLDRGLARSLSGLLGGIPVIQEFDSRGIEEAVLVLGADHQQLRSALQGDAE